MSSFRLSQDIVPKHYDVSFVPDIPKKFYTGELYITFEERKKSDHAELFADQSLKIKSVRQNGSDLKYTHDGNRMNVFGDNLSSAPVEILFDGSLDHFTMGWYYINDECCSSQFESSSARLLMPCFDEPCIKSTFKIAITTLKHLTALSNMPAASIITSPDGKTRKFTFHTTPPMSSYLLALVIGEFDMKTGFTKRGLPVDVIASKGKEELMDMPLAEGIFAIDWLEDFLQVNFPLPRLQMVSVPEFPYGAMENFGLLIFHESCFLAKKGVTSIRSMYNSAITVIHEIVHQWAGNSTSPKWWDSVWLNEGFASIMPYIMIEEEHPEWNIMNNYHTWETAPALSADSTPVTHPICCEANSTEEIEALFDNISYSKAAALIFMLKSHLSLEKLRDSLRVFYNRFKYACADTDDLIAVINEVTGQDMSPFIKYWTSEPGYPLITFNEDGTLSQARFTTSGIIEGQVWPIPLFLLRKKKGSGEIVEEKIMFTTKTMSIKDIVESSEWVKLNSEYKAFCSVWYRDGALKKILPAISNKEINGIERWSILSDSLSVARAGLMPYGDAIRLLEAYSNEDEFIAASPITTFFGRLITYFPSLTDKLRSLGKKVLGGILERIGRTAAPNESPDKSQLRASLLNSLVFQCDDDSVKSIGIEPFRYFREHRKLPDNFDPNLIPFMMRCGARFEPNAVDFLWDVYNTEANPELHIQSAIAIGFGPISYIKDNMAKAFSVRQQDVIDLFAGYSLNPDIGDLFYNFVKDNYAKIYEMFGSLAFTLPSTFEYAAGSFTTNEKADDLEKFFKEHPAAVAEKTVKEIVDRIRSAAKLVEREFESVKEALKNE